MCAAQEHGNEHVINVVPAEFGQNAKPLSKSNIEEPTAERLSAPRNTFEQALLALAFINTDYKLDVLAIMFGLSTRKKASPILKEWIPKWGGIW